MVISKPNQPEAATAGDTSKSHPDSGVSTG